VAEIELGKNGKESRSLPTSLGEISQLKEQKIYYRNRKI